MPLLWLLGSVTPLTSEWVVVVPIEKRVFFTVGSGGNCCISSMNWMFSTCKRGGLFQEFFKGRLLSVTEPEGGISRFFRDRASGSESSPVRSE